MPTIHIVYPHDPSKDTAPSSIGNHLFSEVLTTYERKIYEWQSAEVITPEDGDVLLGHPHPDPKTTFRMSFESPGWARRYVICPFTVNPGQMYFVEPYACRADHFFAICGPTWFSALRDSRLATLGDRMTRLDMAVTGTDQFAPRERFNPPGTRRFIYIGSALPLKGTFLLEKFASLQPRGTVSWLGAPRWAPSHLAKMAYVDLTSEVNKARLREYDFVLSLGKFDANPTVLLEGTREGLIPVCTQGSGYGPESGFVITERTLAGISELNTRLQVVTNEELHGLHLRALASVRTMTWTNFIETINGVLSADLQRKCELSQVVLPKKSLNWWIREHLSPYRKFRGSRPFKIGEHTLYYLIAELQRIRASIRVRRVCK